MNIQLTDPNLKKQFKVFSYKIQSYGDTKAKMSIYSDNFGEYDIRENNFETIPDNHQIEVSDEILDYLDDYIKDFEFNEDDRYYYIDIIFDTKENSIVYNFWRYYNDVETSGFEVDFHDLSDDFQKAVKKFKYMGKAEMSYDGGGDSGWLNPEMKYSENVYRLNGHKKKEDDTLETVIYSLLEDQYGAWGNDEGGYGNIILNFKKKKISVEHNIYVEEHDLIENKIVIKIV